MINEGLYIGNWTISNESLFSTTSMDTSQVTDLKVLLAEKFGPKYKGATETAVLTLMYCIIFITGVIGNVCTCVVIVRNVDMHTATNYYLFSLAVSDSLTLIFGLPPELYTVWEAYPWRFGESYCLFKTFLTEMTSSASVLTILAFTVERYAAICHPLRTRAACSTSRRAVWVVMAVWCLACLTALPYPLHTRLSLYYDNQPDSLLCGIVAEWLPRMRHVFQFSTFLLFVLPMVVITTLYIHIGITLHQSAFNHHQYQATKKVTSRQTSPSYSTANANGNKQSRRVMIKMLVAVVVAFFVSWAPYHAQRLMTIYIGDEELSPALHEVHNVFFTCSGILYFVSATVNPLLYNLMSGKYRRAFRDTLCSCRQNSTLRHRTSSSVHRWNRPTDSALGTHAKQSATVLVSLANRSVTLLPATALAADGKRRTSSVSTVDYKSNSFKSCR